MWTHDIPDKNKRLGCERTKYLIFLLFLSLLGLFGHQEFHGNIRIMRQPIFLFFKEIARVSHISNICDSIVVSWIPTTMSLFTQKKKKKMTISFSWKKVVHKEKARRCDFFQEPKSFGPFWSGLALMSGIWICKASPNPSVGPIFEIITYFTCN